MADVDVLKKSVTHADYNEGVYAGGAGIMHFMLPSLGASADLSGFWSYARDWALYNTIYRESMWASAVYLAVTKQASKSWEVDSDIPKRQKDAQQLFLHFGGGNGWVSGISKHLQAYLLTGNGGPVEIIRASGAPGAKVIGLVPLDPFRTIRTGNTQIPYLYTDRRGSMHELKDYECFCITDQPDVNELWYGVGHCAAERAYKAIQKLEAIERYIYEKVSGNRALALDFVSGVLPAQIEQAQSTARNESAAKGVTTYLGSTIIALAGDQAPTHVRVNLAELPDGFERKEEFDIAILTYARAIGIPVQDLQPLSGQGLGTGAQSQVLEESAKGQGLATWAKSFAHAANEFSLDDKTTFYFRENDIRDREREAKLRIDEATAILTWVQMQAITIEQARQLGVDRDQLPAEFIPVDTTPGGTLSDSEKPVDVSEVTPEDTEIPVAQETEQTAPVIESDAILKSAREIYHSIAGGNASESNPRYDDLIAQQGKLIDALTVKQAQPDLSDSVRKAIDIAWTRVTEPSITAIELGAIKDKLDSVARVGDIAAVHETLDELQAGTLARHKADTRSLTTILDAIKDTHDQHQSELVSLRNNIVTLASKEVRVTVKNDPKAMRQLAEDVVRLSEIAANTATTTKHAGDKAAKVEVIETDRNLLASKVRKTYADGSTEDFRVLRLGNGRIKSLELIQ